MLRRWATNGQLVSYDWNPRARRVVEHPRTSVVNAGQLRGLNALYGVPREWQHAAEDQFFTPRVDTPADAALKSMLSGGVQMMTAAHREAWARFLVTFGLRTPETLREMGPTEFRRAMEIVWGLVPGSAKAGEMKSEERNIPLFIAMDLGNDPKHRETVLAMHWWLERFDRRAILIGDRPLLANAAMPYPCGIPLDDPNCLIVLPITPDTVFFASPKPGMRRIVTSAELAKIVNEETIRCAKQYVYAFDTSLSAFITEKLTDKGRRSSGLSNTL